MKKILKFDKLFEYYEYLKRIDDVSFSEIEIMSNILDLHKISEGLIKTYPLQSSVRILKRRFPTCDISIDVDGEINIEGDLDVDNLKILSNTLGYVISDESDVTFILEPKYDREIDKIPDIIYHSTLVKYINKIIKNGLIPKSKNKISNHTDRIYFSLNLNDAELFKNYLEREYDEKSGIIEISTKNLNNKFYSDIRNRGIYTLNNISKENIKKEIK
jgi:hypothetical protein